MTPRLAIKKLLTILGHPSVSRGFYIGLGAWLTVALLLALNGLSTLLAILGNAWAQQGEQWSAPVQVIMIIIAGCWQGCTFPLFIIGFVWSLWDTWRGKQCGVVGMVLALGWPFLLSASY